MTSFPWTEMQESPKKQRKTVYPTRLRRFQYIKLQMQSKIGRYSHERYSANLLIKMLQAIRPHFKPVLQENLVWAAPQIEVNVLACLGKTEKRKKKRDALYTAKHEKRAFYLCLQ